MKDSLNPDDVRRHLGEAPMRQIQMRALIILVLFSMLDGYNVVFDES